MEFKMALALQLKPLALNCQGESDLLDTVVEAVNFARSGGAHTAQILVKNLVTREGFVEHVQKILDGLAVSEGELKAETGTVTEPGDGDYGIGKITITCTK